MSIKTRTDLFVVLFILLISIFPRLWHLTEFPPMIVDEPANLRDIDKLNSYHNFHPVDYEWGYGQATIVQYPALLMNKLEPDKLLSLRLTSVILSLLTLIPFYFIVRKRTNSLIALCTTILFSFSYYFLQFSRVGWTNIHSLCLGLYLLWLIDVALESKSRILFLLSGAIAGLSLYTYRGGEIYILTGFISLILGLRRTKDKVKKFTIFTFAFFTISLLWISKIFSNYELYNLRSRVVSISNVNLPYHGLYEQTQIMTYQIFTTIKAWIFMLPANGGGIENARYLPTNHGIVSPFVAVLFFIGLILAFRKFKDNFIWIFIYFIGLVFGQIMTVDPPNGSRGLILLPIIYIFSSLTLFKLFKRFKKFSLIKPIMIASSFAIALFDFYFYTTWMSWIRV